VLKNLTTVENYTYEYSSNLRVYTYEAENNVKPPTYYCYFPHGMIGNVLKSRQ